MDGKPSSVNRSLVISFLLAFPLVKKKPKSFIDRKCAPKKILSTTMYRQNNFVGDWK